MATASDDLVIRQKDLDAAVVAGILPQQTARSLADFVRGGAAQVVVSEDEQFRLITGFSDIFVTIGIGLFLGALSYLLTGPFGLLWVAVVAWGLAELFTRQRRMALPSIVLLITFVLALYFGVVRAIAGGGPMFDGNTGALAGAAAVALLGAALHWWRFRVPITVAAGFAALSALVVAIVLRQLPGLPPAIVFLPLGLAAFALAMRFDMRDRLRQTRKADIAFWLHVLAAPMIVHSLMTSLVDTGSMTTSSAVSILALFFVLAIVALVVDRRALLVSSLVYVGYSLGALLPRGGLALLEGSNLAITLCILGAVVLVLSLAWRPLRALLLSLLPETLAMRLPPPAGMKTAKPA